MYQVSRKATSPGGLSCKNTKLMLSLLKTHDRFCPHVGTPKPDFQSLAHGLDSSTRKFAIG